MDHTQTIEKLRQVGYSAVISDCCDAVGLRQQTLDAGITPISESTGVLVGLARPFRSVAVDAPPDPPYAAEIEYIDSLETDDVVIGTAEPPYAVWGELFSTAAMARGAVGIVADGLIRDQRRIAQLDFPTFVRGGRPTDSLGRVSLAERDVPIEVAGVTVDRGDLVVADVDGIVVVPAEAIEEVAARAFEKATTDDNARVLLEGGAYLRDAWEKFKVL